ncbi:MAG: HlyD family efflux transporter periplasmic adaptor subunit [Candidatus Obscuribacterales bacterium]|nr:HlyD family efflux transporter periplasmic adaptor subunit [Candidatus Obscuribacterales bacterium]
MPDIQQRSPSDFVDLEHMPQRSAATHALDRHDTPVRLACTLLYATGIFIGLILVWAALARVPEIAVAPGQIVPVGNLKQIQPVADGAIMDVFVKEGQFVRKDEKLISLDRVPYAAELSKSKQDLEIAESELVEHQKAKEALGAIIKDPLKLPIIEVDINSVSQTINEVYKTYRVWREAQTDLSISQNSPNRLDKGSAFLPIDSDMSMLTERLRNVSAQKKACEDTLAKRRVEFLARKNGLIVETNSLAEQLLVLKQQKKTNDSILEHTKEQAARMKEARDAGALSLLDYLNAIKAVETQQLAILSNSNEIVKTEHLLSKAKTSQTEFESKSKADLSQAASEVERLSGEIAEVTMRIRERRRNMSISESTYYAALEKAKALLSQESNEVLHQIARVEQAKAGVAAAQYKYDRAEMRAPLNGVVTSLKHGKGDVVSQKEILMTIVPSSAPLVVEARLPNSDRGFVSSGQEVKLKLTAFPFQDFGIVKGLVKDVEWAPRDNDKLNGYYRVTIEPERSYMDARGKRIYFAAGMGVTAEIITRHRTVLNILLEPFKNLQETRWN